MKDKPLSVEICAISHLIMRYTENMFQDATSISGTNSWIIAYLAENKDKDVFQRDLEKTFSVTRSSTSKVIKLMVQKGLIKRCSVPYDARLKKLVLTPKAIILHNAIVHEANKIEGQLTKGFSTSEIENLYSYIERMKDNMKNV